jgi:hypothetical protein
MNKLLLTLYTLTALLLSACASRPPAPDWQNNAFAALNNFTNANLKGNIKVAAFEFARAKTEVARTGRADLMARLELARCAIKVASLDLQTCTDYEALAPDAQAPERAYAAFISGAWAGLDPALLPETYRGLVTQILAAEKSGAMPNATTANQPQDTQATSALSQIQDPLSRLIAAGALFQGEQLTLMDIGLAIKTASDQGWPLPLLSWLGEQLRRQLIAGNTTAATQTQRRIDLVMQSH